MTNPKALVFGRSGQVGWELRQQLARIVEVSSIEYPKVDFARPETIRKAVRAAQPTVIVNAAAYTAVDKAESEPENAWAINATAPGVLAEEARRLGCTLVHYSTDYVYDGAKPGAYGESDSPNPQNVYGKTKLAGDQAIEAVGGDYLILRTSWVYGARGNNFLLTMRRLAKEQAELRIVDDQTGAPTSAECIAKATTDILAQVLAPGGAGLNGRSGVYNLTCSGVTTWFGFAKAFLSRTADSEGTAMPNLIPVSTSEFPRPAKRPANSRLSCQRLADTFGVRVPSWEEALEAVLERLAQAEG